LRDVGIGYVRCTAVQAAHALKFGGG
jgi:hypothetical protein